MSGKPQLVFYASRCIGCGACVQVCPEDAQVVSPTERRILWDSCNNCGKCSDVCPTNALETEGKWFTADEVVDVVKRDMNYYKNSGGGVTFSGGEPTYQSKFLKDCLKKCKELGVHTAIDTCGFLQWPVLEQLLPHIDLFLFDIKHMNSSAHENLTGVKNDLILTNLRHISEQGKSIWIRVPLIPDHNDSEQNLAMLAEYIKPLTGVEKITLLPYNDAAAAKYGFIGEKYRLADIEPYSMDESESILKIFSKFVGYSEDDLRP